jgi:xylulose-5-phosphate/fructose-6-phosphate phosphoketolase
MKTISEKSVGPLSPNLLRDMDDYWRATLYLCVGMIYLRENPLLRQPLINAHIKRRLLGHWGTDPGQTFTWLHLNRLIMQHDLKVLFVSGPGHGAPAMLAHAYLEGSYTDAYPDITQDEAGMQRFFKQFSFPGGVGSHCTPETPGSMHEGGELGYSLSHAFGAAFDHPDLLVACMVGDGEAETGPLATAWHSIRFLNPARDGAVLPILHLNGYKIANPTLLGRMESGELNQLFTGLGYQVWEVAGDDPARMHQQMAATMDEVLASIRAIQCSARNGDTQGVPRWPMIILKTPKGWTGPARVDGHQVEGTWRSHQIPFKVQDNPEHLRLLEQWLRSYEPDQLFDESGRLVERLRRLSPQGNQRISANPAANGGLCCQPLDLPSLQEYAIDVRQPGQTREENTRPLGRYLAQVIRSNPHNFRFFCPDETASNRLDDIYKATGKAWMGRMLPEDRDGGNLARDGRIMEMLSEHTLEGWLEGYLLTGRHGLLASYEAFINVIGSMFNQHAKWLEKAIEVPWRAPVPSLNLLLTSTVWRQDHNGFSHQDPGFLDLVTNKSARVVRIYLPPDANCLLAVSEHCLGSRDNVNVIVCDKQNHLQYLPLAAAQEHCRKGIGIWEWASNCKDGEPDVVIASAGDVPTLEALGATALLRQHLPELRVRFVNVVDLFRLVPRSEHPHGLEEDAFERLFTRNSPIIFNFHGYPWLIHKLAYRHANSHNLHVRGYKEHGSINTPMELAIQNQIDRFDLVIDVIDRVPGLGTAGAAVRQEMLRQITNSIDFARREGDDSTEYSEWRWP